MSGAPISAIASSSASAESYLAIPPDVRLSSTTAWLLPSYNTLPVALQSAIDGISLFDPTTSIDTAPSRMSYNTRLIAWNGLTEKHFMLIPLGVPEAPAIYDFAFLDTCGYVILSAKGQPSEVLTHAIIIVIYGNRILEGIAVGANVVLNTPAYFLVAAGDLIPRCSQLQLELLKHLVDTMGTSNKRQRLLQGTTGVQAASSPGERQGTYLTAGVAEGIANQIANITKKLSRSTN